MQTILDRIGIGPTHIWMIIALSLVEVINGYKIVMISLISPLLKEQWGLDEEIKNVPLAFYCGIIAGSFLGGSLANFSGRKATLLFGQTISGLSSLMIIYSHQFTSFLITLIISGIGFGITLIMANTLLSELMPQKYRGRSLVFVSFIAILGKFFAILAAYYFQLKNWRSPQFLVALVGLTLSLVILLKIPESFRVLLMKGQVKQSQKILSNLLTQQNKPSINRAEHKILKEWSKKNFKQVSNKTSFYEIFNKNSLKATIMLSLSWFIINFMFYGQLFIMPFIFQKKDSGAFTQFAQMILGELPSIFLTFNMIERQKFGRRNSIVIFFALTALLNLSLVYIQSVFIISLSRLAMKSVLQILYPFTTQSYSTPVRSSGLAFCAGAGRLGSILMPIIVYPLYKIDSYLVFVAFMIASSIGVYSGMNSKQTLNHSLDDFEFQKPHDQVHMLSNNDLQQSIHHTNDGR